MNIRTFIVRIFFELASSLNTTAILDDFKNIIQKYLNSCQSWNNTKLIQVDYWKQHTVPKILSFMSLRLILAIPLVTIGCWRQFSRSLRVLTYTAIIINTFMTILWAFFKGLRSTLDTPTLYFCKNRMIQPYRGEF